MAYYDKCNSSIRDRLLAELIIENHESFAKGSPAAELILKNPEFFNFTGLVEDMMARCSDGKYNFIDGIHEDFDDGSECKTGTLHVSAQGSTAEISSVKSKTGVLKKGGIRCVVLNPILEKLHFFFIPQASLLKLMTTKKGTIKKSNSAWLRYDKNKNVFTTIKKYGIIELKSFKELAMMENH